MEQDEMNRTCIKPDEVPTDDTRMRILRMLQLMQQETDEEHPISTPQIQKRMEQLHGIKMHRTRVPIDLSALAAAGYQIRADRGRGWTYYYEDQTLSPAELRLLIDAVRASRFISGPKSAELADKLIRLGGKRAEALSDRVIRVPDRVHSETEKGYPVVDIVSRAISEGRKISFPYFYYSNSKEAILKNNGEPYVVSPFDMVWDGDCYYLIGHCDQRKSVRVFRADRIAETPVILQETAVEKPDDYFVEKYTALAFRMFGAEEAADVELLCEESAMNTVLDHFGMGAETTALENGRFKAKVRVFPTPMFYRWVFGSCGTIRIQGPQAVKDAYKAMLTQAMEE